ncbi:MAG: glycosyltransferase family 4 protein [Saprospiraceae bacterium]|nr:glycosyltransferase family 4 protein [Saprospiraceae bacterium]
MKIGYDAKRAFHNFTGLGNYSRTLIETLTTHFPENEYHLFTPKLNDLQRVTKITMHPSVKVHTPEDTLGKKLSALWRSYTIKNDIEKQGIQIFHGLSHELPLSTPSTTRTVVTIHDLIHERYPSFYPFIDRKVYSFKFKRACQQADAVVAISEQTKQDIIDFYKIDASKVQVIYQSCDPIFYKNRPLSIESEILKKYNLPNHFLLYVGTINERKNLLGLVKALKAIDNQKDIKLVVIGDGGDYLTKVKKFVTDNDLHNRIVFIPKIDFQDLPTIYKLARIFVLPSFFEGFGIPIIEALWSGVPVISSVDSCFSEAGGPHSIYINPYNVDELVHAIDLVWHDETLRNYMILRGYEYVEKFKDDQIGATWIKLYESLL